MPIDGALVFAPVFVLGKRNQAQGEFVKFTSTGAAGKTDSLKGYSIGMSDALSSLNENI
jgi:hypothetical protein